MYSGNTMYPNGDAGARGTGAKHSGTDGAQREPSGATIVEESEDVEKGEEEPAEQSEPAPRQQLARRTADVPFEDMPSFFEEASRSPAILVLCGS